MVPDIHIDYYSVDEILLEQDRCKPTYHEGSNSHPRNAFTCYDVVNKRFVGHEFHVRPYDDGPLRTVDTCPDTAYHFSVSFGKEAEFPPRQLMAILRDSLPVPEVLDARMIT